MKKFLLEDNFADSQKFGPQNIPSIAMVVVSSLLAKISFETHCKMHMNITIAYALIAIKD